MADDQASHRVFLSHDDRTRDLVEFLALRMYGDARLSFWFAPWHSIPGVPVQEQMEEALLQAQSCAVLIGFGPIQGWQNEQMRAAIQRHVEDDSTYRVIPVLVPGATRPKKSDLPPFLRRFEAVGFRSLDDELAFKRLQASILRFLPIPDRDLHPGSAERSTAPTEVSGKIKHACSSRTRPLTADLQSRI
jgi:hypothetical protein